MSRERLRAGKKAVKAFLATEAAFGTGEREANPVAKGVRDPEPFFKDPSESANDTEGFCFLAQIRLTSVNAI